MEATTAGADEEDERPSPRAPEGAKRRWRWSQLLTTMKVRWLAKGICEDDFLSDQQDLTECLNKVQIYVFGKILKRKMIDDQAEDDHREDDQPQDDTKGVKPAASAYCASRELRLNAGKCGNEDVAAKVIHVAKVLAAALRDVVVWRCVGLSLCFQEPQQPAPEEAPAQKSKVSARICRRRWRWWRRWWRRW